MIKGEVTGGGALARFFGDRPSKLTRSMTERITRLALMLQRKVKAEKLSGQVLSVRTGRLRRGINYRVEGAGTQHVAGIVGTNTVYARPHEYGFHGAVQVKESLRTIKQAWGRAIEPRQVTVRAHSARLNLPERSFLRSALAEMGPTIEKELRAGITEALT